MIDLNDAIVVLPGYSEYDLTLGFTNALDDLALQIFGMFGYNRPKTLQNFKDCLMELGLARIALQDFLIHPFNLYIDLCH